MTEYDFDVIVIGSGFGGSVAAFRAAEKGYRVAVLESGKRLPDEVIPKTDWDLKEFLWFPGLELYGMQRLEVLDDTLVMGGAGVGGGSQIYSMTLYVPPMDFYQSPHWSDITDWADELAPFIGQAKRMLGVSHSPYLPNAVDRMLANLAKKLGNSSFNEAPEGVYFGEPGVEADDPYFGGVGPRRRGCINCGNCMVGCGHNSKNKLDTNYLYLAEALGAQIHELHEVFEVSNLDSGGFEVLARHPGWAQRAVHAGHHRFTAGQVVVAAHAYGSSKLLTHMQHDGKLAGMSDQVGQRARTNSEQLLAVSIPYDVWREDPERWHFAPGTRACTSAVWPDRWTSVEPCFYGLGSDAMGMMLNWHQHGHQDHPTENWIKEMITHPGTVFGPLDVRHWSERTVMFNNMQSKDNYIDLLWHDGMMHSRKPADMTDPLRIHTPVIEDFIDKIAAEMGGEEHALLFEVINRNASSHFIGGQTIGETPDTGAVDPYQRVFGQPGLHVIDGAVMPANPGVNPSLMITALAERAMSFWPNKGEDDQRPSLGSGYKRIKPVMPHRPFVPAGAPGEYRLDATPDEVIPPAPGVAPGTKA